MNLLKDKEIKLKEFLKEVQKLQIKYGFEIGGCGCCGSPFIEGVIDNGIIEFVDFTSMTYKVIEYS